MYDVGCLCMKLDRWYECHTSGGILQINLCIKLVCYLFVMIPEALARYICSSHLHLGNHDYSRVTR